MITKALIGLVDDDPGMLRALRRLLREEGFEVLVFSSAQEFLDRPADRPIDCLVLDVSMPGLSGLQLQDHLNRSDTLIPLVFLTGRGDIPMTVQAIQAGAVDFLTKPVDDADLLAAIRRGLAISARRRTEEQGLADLRTRLSQVTPREIEVLRHVITGKLNKQIAADLGISEQTVKVHRMRITEKMGLASVAELVRACGNLGIEQAD